MQEAFNKAINHRLIRIAIKVSKINSLPTPSLSYLNYTKKKGDDLMSAEQTICAICAWRATCQKMFSMSGRDLKCADFARDVSIKEEKKDDSQKENDRDE
jgi:hypothetical protein